MRHAMRPAVILASLLAFSGASIIWQVGSAAVAASAVYKEAARTLLAEGQAALDAGNAAAALRAFETALVADPGSVAAMVAIGKAHEAMGQRPQGLGYYRRALVIDPANRAALEAEALALLADGKLEDAEENAARLEKLCAAAGCPELEAVRAAVEAYRAKSVAGAPATQGGTL